MTGWLLAAAAALAAFALWVPVRVAANARAAERAHPPAGEIVEVAGRPVHLLVEGAGPPLVLIHGASGNLRDFTYALTAPLAARFRLLLSDRPGLGNSAPLHGRGESPAEQARVILALMDRAGVGRALVLGHSYGGAVALALALEAPGRVAGLALVAAASNPWPGDLGLLYRVNRTPVAGAVFRALVAAFPPRRILRRTLAGVFAPAPVPPGYARHIALDLTLRQRSLKANAAQVNALRPHLVAMAPRYGEIRCPVEILHGLADDTVPAAVHSEPLSRQIPQARLTLLPGAGHMPHHSHPQAVIAALDRLARAV
jgi:pimeloyl-ACP methyl ester carboxylesterase